MQSARLLKPSVVKAIADAVRHVTGCSKLRSKAGFSAPHLCGLRRQHRPFPVPRQNGSNILRDNLFNIPLAAYWHGNNQSSDHDCKIFVRFHPATVTAPPVFAMLLQQSAKQHFCEALRSRATGSCRTVLEPTMG